jgi:hypothetical protein
MYQGQIHIVAKRFALQCYQGIMPPFISAEKVQSSIHPMRHPRSTKETMQVVFHHLIILHHIFDLIVKGERLI